jgi:hypothetical protein
MIYSKSKNYDGYCSSQQIQISLAVAWTICPGFFKTMKKFLWFLLWLLDGFLETLFSNGKSFQRKPLTIGIEDPQTMKATAIKGQTREETIQ